MKPFKKYCFLFIQRQNMILTYYILFFTFFSFICKKTVQNDNLQYNENNGCKCGRRDDHSFRIVGGEEAEPNSNPWMAALFYKVYKKIFCGGVLINDRYVLTAAHCVKILNKENLAVVLGLHDKKLFEENKEGLMVEIDTILMHENFTTIAFYDINDLALIKLSQIITFTKKIKPICLPTNPDEEYIDKRVQVMGWGKIFYEVGASSRFLKITDLRVVSKEDCKNHKIIGRFILDSMLCAYRDRTDACQGDSGGPLIYETISGKVELIGIVSWGIRCAKPDTPGVYTRVTSNLRWIAKNTEDAVYCRNL